MFQKYHRLGIIALTIAILSVPASLMAQAKAVKLRFVDSETGFAVDPEAIEIHSSDPGKPLKRTSAPEKQKPGRATLTVEPGVYTVAVTSPKYKPMVNVVNVEPDFPYTIQFVLDPVVASKEVSPEHIATLHRRDETVFVGYVSDEDDQPLENVSVRSEPSGRTGITDSQGYFQIYVPVQTLAEAQSSPAKLFFEKRGFRSEERRYLELWSEGDWVYRIALSRGSGKNIVDERNLRRRSHYPISYKAEPDAVSARDEEAKTPAKTESFELISAAEKSGGPTKNAASTTAHVRIPTNIRVLLSDNVTIEYVSMQTYCQRSLPAEWIASWGSTGPGNSGTNSLNAGAVASRTYAVGYVNQPASSTYDICATTTCQVYGTTTDSRTTAAANFTDGYVMFRPGDSRIGFKLTEYSAENNSLGFSCGDGYTQPNGGCIYDPVCTGETRFGHGRGMCQWGTARWASGRRMQNRVTSDSVTNGYPIQNWIWLCEHYYPNLVLAKGAPLAIGDDVKVLGSSVAVRQCPGNTITNGVNCPSVATKAVNSTGTIIGGPIRVTSDGNGYTWWQVDWGDTNGWSVENYLERVSATPTAPSGLSANVISSSQINLSWTDNSDNEIGFMLERALSSVGPWLTNEIFRAGITSYSDTNVNPSTTYYYRIRGFNQTANSAYSSTTSATTPGLPPVLTPISNKTISEGVLWTYTNIATATDFETPLTDFESFGVGNEVIFQEPTFSGSTVGFLTTPPNVSAVASSFPSGNSSTRAYNVNFAFQAAASNPWLRLTTSGAANIPNPVIDFTKYFRFKIHTDKALRVALGCRETTTASGTPIGSNGGSSGAIEFVGVTDTLSGQPQPVRTVSAGAWTTLTFNLPAESVRSFASGNGVLSTASGLGVLEHLVFVPGAGNTSYNVYLDDFVVFTPNTLTYSLDVAPSGMTINPSTGIISWTPTEAQGPGVYNVTVRVTDSNVPAQSDTESFQVTVNEVNSAPSLNVPPTQNISEGSLLTVTNTASDSDIPANSLTFGLVFGPSGLTLNPTTGVVTWTPSEAQGPSTNTITVRVFDNGSPSLSTTNSFTIIVGEVNVAPVLTVPGNQVLNEMTAFTVTNSASDADVPANTLTFSLLSPPAGLTIHPTTGVISWTPAEDQGPFTNTITVRVTDNGSPNLNDTESFTVTVNEVNVAPILTPIANQTAAFNQLLTVTNSATDSDIPTNTLTFSLVTAPSGMTINPASGTISWTPNSGQAGTTNNVIVRVTDNGSPALNDEESFTVIVEGNLPPVLTAIPNRTVHAGSAVTFTNSATDPETNSFTFSLDAGAPPTATVNPTNGVFNWTTTEANAGGISNITVRVTDDGVPPASDTKTFAVTIEPGILINSFVISNNSTFTVGWNSISGAVYRISYKTNLSQIGWINLTPDVTATGPASSRTETVLTGVERYYRVTLINY